MTPTTHNSPPHEQIFKGWHLAGLGFIPAGFLGFFGFNPILAQTTNLGFFKMRHKG
jgi:hypothetical protein